MKKHFFIVDSKSWHPSSFYDNSTQLTWVMEFKLFRKIYTGKVKSKPGNKYAIHKDVYTAFMNKLKNMKKTRKKYT